MGWIPRRRHEDRRPGEQADATGPSYGPGSADDGRDGDGQRAVAENTGDATASGGGTAISGVWINQLVRQEAPRQPAPWPHLVGNPPGQALGFQERAESSQLRLALEAEGTAVVGQVLSGLGGVGKTQLAADYARTAFASGRLDVLVWVTAASRQAVIDGYTRAAVELLGGEPDEHSAQRFLAWLQPSAARAVCRWLVVLDDLADPADLTGLWPPACASGRTVVTTRRRSAALTGPGRRRVDVGVFTPGEAAAALHQVLAERGHPAQPPEQVEALAAELGFLPLALSQAAAYITNEDIGVQRYRDLLAARLLHEVVPEEGELPDDHQRIISATWELSIDQADAARPAGLAPPVLQLASMLDPAGIPQAVLSGPPALAHLATYLPGQEHAVDEATVDAALRVLHRYSLIDHDRDSRYREVRVHQLVQRATRENLAGGQQGPAALAALANAAADALVAVWPQVERDELGQVLRANTTALEQAAGLALWNQGEGGHGVLFRSAASLGETGQAAAARDAYAALLRTALDHLGPDHPDILTARNDLAAWRGTAGDLAGTVTAFRELLADLLRVHGPDQSRTLAARNNLARWRGEAGDPAGAVTAFKELLADCLRVLGPDDPRTLAARGNLARWRGAAGDPAGAATATEELVADCLRVHGPDHPDTLTNRGNLAYWRGQAGDPAGAAAATEEQLADCLRVLGPDHPRTLTARGNLARWRGEAAGDPAGAAAATEELVADCLRVLGPDHPDTLTNRRNLASWRGKAGDPAGAAAAFEELRADHLRVLGPNHPDTLINRSSLARWRRRASLARWRKRAGLE